MILTCPNCQSSRIGTKDFSKKACGILGAIGGAASGATGTLSGAELGGSLGLSAGPVGVFTGAVLGALVGSVTAGIAGAKLGKFIDEKILDNYHCLNCHYVFSQRVN